MSSDKDTSMIFNIFLLFAHFYVNRLSPTVRHASVQIYEGLFLLDITR